MGSLNGETKFSFLTTNYIYILLPTAILNKFFHELTSQ